MPYVESPLDRIVNVNWGVSIVTTLQVVLNAQMTGPPITVPQDPTSHMIVSVTGLPPLARTELTVGNPPDHGFNDDEIGSFPDEIPPAPPTGEIDGEYHFEFRSTASPPTHTTFSLGATASYGTTAAGNKRFGGADAISISVQIQTTEVYSGEWIAEAQSSIAAPQLLSGSMGNTKTVTAVLTLDPPSLSFG